MLSFITWLALGIVTGFVASRLLQIKSVDLPCYLGLGAIGAVIGGWRSNTHGLNIISGWSSSNLNVYGLFLAVVGAVVLVLAYHWLFHSMLERAEENSY